MLIDFQKYHGTGNDFILLDGKLYKDVLSPEQIAMLCHRNYGVGADGLIIIAKGMDNQLDMQYFNSDGSRGMMCGNGARCAVHFAEKLNLFEDNCIINCCEKLYHCKIESDNIISITFPDVMGVNKVLDGWLVDSGAAHYIEYRGNQSRESTVLEGRKIRYLPLFMPAGVNVNFIEEILKNKLKISTYEKGVEYFTLSCGTGAVAAAIAHALHHDMTGAVSFELESEGGILVVSFEIQENQMFTNIVQSGPASFVFEGSFGIMEK